MNRKFAISMLFLLGISVNALADSTFKQMKEDVARGNWEVIWSDSYGFEKAGVLAACVYFGCAQEYLKHELSELKSKVGKQLIEQALRNKGTVMFGPGKLEVQAGNAYWSTYYNVWNPLRNRNEEVTTARYVRLYVKYRRKISSSSDANGRCRNSSNIFVKVSDKNVTFGRNKIWETCTGYRTIFQGDGNFVVYNPSGHAVWNSSTHGKGGTILAMQTDGNLVIYTKGGKPVWHSHTNGNPGAFLAIQQDGNVVIYNRNSKPIWNTGTNGK